MNEADKAGEFRGGPMLGQLPAGYDAVGECKRLLRATRSGALATIQKAGGHPFATLVTVATDHDGSPILLMSQLSAHTKNLDADPRCSILLSQGGKGDPLAHPRLTVFGAMIKQSDEAARARLKGRFLARHPKSALGRCSRATRRQDVDRRAGTSAAPATSARERRW